MNTAVRALYHVPFVGWALKDAVGGKVGALYLLVAYALLAVVGLVYRFGFPAFMIIMLAATAASLIGLVVLTAGDFFAGKGAKRRPS